MSPLPISVLIVTRDRAQALAQSALPPLARQTLAPFEVLVWDASDGEASRQVVEAFAAAHPALPLRYRKAPRGGSSSQRNDAVQELKGEVVLFLDDDAELSDDGLEALAEAFADPEVAGAGLDIRLTPAMRALHANRSRAELLFRRLFLLPAPAARPYCLASGWNRYTLEPYAGEAEWLCSCCAAFRRALFADHRFDESLQRFGGYAYAEDVLFSQRLFREGRRLVIAPRGSAFHNQAEGGRLDTAGAYAARVYNHFVLWREATFPFLPWSFLAYWWSAKGFGTFLLLTGLLKGDGARLKGLAMGAYAILDDLLRGKGL